MCIVNVSDIERRRALIKKLEQQAADYANSKERAGCSYWKGLYHGYLAALLKQHEL